VIVVDASVIVAALSDDSGFGALVGRRLRGESLAAPHLLPVEVAAAWRRLVMTGRLEGGRAERALDDLALLQVTLVPHGSLLPRCWELRPNVTTFDAMYVALAESLGVPLFTLDTRMTRAPGPRCAFMDVVD